MRHLVLTRSAYGQGWSRDAIERRLAIFRGVTARLMAAQTERRLTWVVLVDAADPLADERRSVVASTGLDYRILTWDSSRIAVAQAPWDRAKSTTLVQKVAASAYRAPWADAIGDRSEVTLLTRIDDDDGFTPDAMHRVRRAAEAEDGRSRVALMLPRGIRIWKGLQAHVRHPTNAMHTLLTPPGDTATVYDYGHRGVERYCPVRMVDERAGWLWVRHPDTISGHRKADAPITNHTRALFPIDWSVVG